MGIAELDELVNTAGLSTFGEPVVFHVDGVPQAPMTVVFETPIADVEVAGVPVTAPQPQLQLRKTELVALAAKAGDYVVIRGKRYRLLAGHTDPVEDAGGMAHVPLAADPEP